MNKIGNTYQERKRSEHGQRDLDRNGGKVVVVKSIAAERPKGDALL